MLLVTFLSLFLLTTTLSKTTPTSHLSTITHKTTPPSHANTTSTHTSNYTLRNTHHAHSHAHSSLSTESTKEHSQHSRHQTKETLNFEASSTLKERVESKCGAASDCGAGAVCLGSGHCTCPVGHVWSQESGPRRCQAVVCSAESDCWPWENSICERNTSRCICTSAYTYSSTHTTCTLRLALIALLALGTLFLLPACVCTALACLLFCSWIASMPALFLYGVQLPRSLNRRSAPPKQSRGGPKGSGLKVKRANSSASTVWSSLPKNHPHLSPYKSAHQSRSGSNSLLKLKSGSSLKSSSGKSRPACRLLDSIEALNRHAPNGARRMKTRRGSWPKSGGGLKSGSSSSKSLSLKTAIQRVQEGTL